MTSFSRATAEAVRRLNPGLSGAEVADVIATFRRPESVDLMAENWRAYPAVDRRGASGAPW